MKCHCPTTGRIGDLELSGLPCLYSTSANAKRKTAYTVEAISTSPTKKSWLGINQTASNRYLEFFLKKGALSKMVSGPVTREVRLGKSRIDFLVGDTYVEAKTPLITLPAGEGVARVRRSRFDSYDRLVKHMGELRKSLSGGRRAIIVLCYLYDAKPFKPPLRDGTNSRILKAASMAEKAGVERWQVNLHIDEEGVSLIRYFRNSPS
jgi:sugar fermentation stimulation protein A